MKDIIKPKIFQLDSDTFGIRSEAVVPGAGRVDGPGYSVVVPIQIFWCGDSWSRVVCREFLNREEAEKHLAANLDLMIKRAEKQFGSTSNTNQASLEPPTAS
jgi:hypothetical protein